MLLKLVRDHRVLLNKVCRVEAIFRFCITELKSENSELESKLHEWEHQVAVTRQHMQLLEAEVCTVALYA